MGIAKKKLKRRQQVNTPIRGEDLSMESLKSVNGSSTMYNEYQDESKYRFMVQPRQIRKIPIGQKKLERALTDMVSAHDKSDSVISQGYISSN